MRFLLALLCGPAFLIAPAVWASPMALFRTPLGDIEVELYDASKPATVANFIKYVESGAYTTNMFIHRWEPNFVIQGGGFYTADRHTTNAGIAAIPTFPPVTNEYSVGRIFSNTYGTIAMARASGQTNSATSQWFFNLKDNSGLDKVDGGFTVFGRVLRGTNVLNRFLGGEASKGIYTVDIGGALTTLPVLSSTPGLEDLVYVDITLLDVRIASQPAGAQTISWQSVSNKLNRVEFTTRMPPVWTELASTNGTGQLMQVTDPVVDPNRFYRVRVDY